VAMFRNGLRVSACMIAFAGCSGHHAHSVLLIEIVSDGICIPELCQEQGAQIAGGLTMQLAKVPKCVGVQAYPSNQFDGVRATGNRWSLTVTRHLGTGPSTLTWVLTDNKAVQHDGRSELEQIASDVCQVISRRSPGR
jgi:hypothetical protein